MSSSSAAEIEQMPTPTDAEGRFKLLRSVGEECVSEADLKNLIEKKPGIRCYDGFEPSGRMHIAQGIYKAINVNKCTASGCTFVFWVADWFALMNDKMGGELERIRTTGKYLLEVWKSAGMNMDNVEFLWASEEINSNDKHAEYWRTVLDIGRRNTLARLKKCCTIMGKQEGTLTAAQIMYPLMQCSDVFFLRSDICQLGLDQRKVNMLAREYCDQIGRKLKPVILSHHMLAGLKAGQAKMSKSDPDSAIFMEDTPEDVERKIKAAHCPRIAQVTREVSEDGLTESSDDMNPCLDYLKCIVFSVPNTKLTTQDGTTYTSYEETEAAFVNGTLNEEALKQALTDAVNARLAPVRKHFKEDAAAQELLETVKSFKKGEPAAASSDDTDDKAAAPPPKLAVWLPALTKLPLGVTVSITTAIKSFLAAHPAEETKSEVTILLPELSSFARNELTGDEKDLASTLSYNASIVKEYLASVGLTSSQNEGEADSSVRFVKQTDTIGKDPNAYWFSVINTGRKHSLNQIEEAVGEIKSAGQVVSVLMRGGDASALGITASLSLAEYDLRMNHLLATYRESVVGKPCPTTDVTTTAPIPLLCDPKTTPTSDDDTLFSDDSDMDIRRKIKKAFAAEKDPENPVVGIASWLLTSSGTELTIKRPPQFGGDLVVSSSDQLKSQYAAGELHPGDLKTAVANGLLERTARIRDAVKSNGELKKLNGALRQIEKKMAKRK